MSASWFVSEMSVKHDKRQRSNGYKASRNFVQIKLALCLSPCITDLTICDGKRLINDAILSGFGQRSFSVSGPDAWNSLSRQLRGIAVASTFTRHLKSELFFQAYGVSTIASTVAEP